MRLSSGMRITSFNLTALTTNSRSRYYQYTHDSMAFIYLRIAEMATMSAMSRFCLAFGNAATLSNKVVLDYRHYLGFLPRTQALRGRGREEPGTSWMRMRLINVRRTRAFLWARSKLRIKCPSM